MTDALPQFSLWRRLCHTRLRDVLRGRLDSSLDWRQSIDRAELPKEIAGVVGQVVRRTRLWRKEKVDVAAELIAHFQDGLAAGRPPAELLESFGDGQSAAQLIRRAKKRGRPMWWHAWHYGWMGAVALIVLYIGIGLWMSTGRPSVRTDYLAQLNKAPLSVPEAERAWPLYRDALLAMSLKPTQASPTGLPSYDTILDADSQEAQELQKLVAQHADSIAKLREASKRPHLGFVTATSHANFSAKDRELFGVTLTPEQIEAAKHETLEDRWLMSTLIPNEQSLRTSAGLLASDALRAAAAKDGQTAWDDVVAMFGISRHCEETPFLISVLVGDAVQQEARGVIRNVISQHPDLWTNDQLRDLAHEMSANRPGWQQGFDSERIGFEDCMQRIYTDDGHGDGRLALQVSHDKNLFQLLDSVAANGAREASMFESPGMALLGLPAANMVVAGRKEMSWMYGKTLDKMLARMASPYWKWSGEPSLDKEVHSLTNGPVSRFRYLFVLLMTPSYDTLLNKVVVSDTDREGVFIGLALELYHREHHKWPSSLDELSPRWLPTLSADPITGMPLHYKVVNDRPIVYSVGVDNDDDGGRIPKDVSGETRPEFARPKTSGPNREAIQASEKDGDWVLWSTAKSG